MCLMQKAGVIRDPMQEWQIKPISNPLTPTPLYIIKDSLGIRERDDLMLWCRMIVKGIPWCLGWGPTIQLKNSPNLKDRAA